ncbi:MAG: polysialyltransferase family glycosyltransferase [Algibacter sp.]|uniref:polysialyltransferase family glycosyltransferase n=1 Tax=Algibacter sp. TaxID=1872428 RepID=UPI0032987DF5
MNNLFVCHSQAQLIVASGLAKGRFCNDTNTLILFKDFSLDDKLILNLNKVFHEVLIRVGDYPEKNKSWRHKTIRYIRDVCFFKKEIISIYHKVFIICDQNLPELYIIKKAFKLNNDVELIWLEDGSYPYFLNIDNKHGLNANKYTIKLKKLIFKYLFQFGPFYDYEGNYMSGNSNLKIAYLTMPECARSIFKNKTLVKIDSKEYLLGINSIFTDGETTHFKDNDVIIVFDKLDTYKSVNIVKEITEYLILLLKEKQCRVFFKMHPREETENLKFLGESIELNRHIGFEFFLSTLVANANKSVKIIGFKSTSLQVSKFFNLETISLFLLVKEENVDLHKFYERLNISLPKIKQDLKDLI